MKKKQKQENLIRITIAAIVGLLLLFSAVKITKYYILKVNEAEQLETERLHKISEVTKVIQKEGLIENDDDFNNWLNSSSSLGSNSASEENKIAVVHSTLEATNEIYFNDAVVSNIIGVEGLSSDYKCLDMIEISKENLDYLPSCSYKITKGNTEYTVIPDRFMAYIILEKVDNKVGYNILKVVDDIYEYTGLTNSSNNITEISFSEN